MSDTATVETLTAEVQVLMVGKRQVTLSVARQLDEVRLDELEMFGRVRLSGSDSNSYVIGRHAKSGSLSLAAYTRSPEIPLVADLSGKVTVCRRITEGRRSGLVRMRYGGQPIKLELGSTESCGVASHTDWAGEECGQWFSNGLDIEIQKQIDIDVKHAELCKSAANLPLIVLAGLK